MGPSSPIPISELPFDLFPVISSHLPLIYRPSTLLSLALTCHRLYEVVVPYLLYNAVRVQGEEQALRTLNMLTAKAAPMNEEDIQKKRDPSPSHCIHHLCIDTLITIPILTSDHSINALRKLIDVDGLRHLSYLTLHINRGWGKTSPTGTNIDLALPSLFLVESLKKCPQLKNIYLTDFTQDFKNRWIEHELFSIKRFTSIRVESTLTYNPAPTFNFLQLPPNLHTLELQVSFYAFDLNQSIDASGPGGLFDCVIPNLNTLILDDFTVSDPTSSLKFWRAHPGIKRLELGHNVSGSWFNSFEVGMLPDLSYLECNVEYALVLLPQASKMLIRLSLLYTCNAQGPYLLRAVVPEGVLLALRSLSIHRDSRNTPILQEGHLWREDENGGVSQADARRPSRQFDGNYIMSISKAAPNLEELELMGASDDSLDSITASLSRFPKLQRLTLSGGVSYYNKPFFARSVNWTDYAGFGVGGLPEKDYGKYAPESFDEAARDLANGCRTLTVVTVGKFAGKLVIQNGLSAKIVRECEGGLVKEVKRIRAWGNIIGREEEW